MGETRALLRPQARPHKPRRRLVKSILEARGTLAATSTLLRLYRTAMYGSFLFDHDPRLLRLLRTKEPALFAVWHQDFVHTLGYLSRWNPARPTYVLASQSRDGALAAAAARAMGFRRPIRGSSARGGAGALLAMSRLLEVEENASLVVVSDGPRPPARRLQPGIVWLASTTQRPLWLLRTSFAKKRVLANSWAQFHLPFPASRAAVRADGPIHLPPTPDRAALETYRAELERRLDALATRTDATCAALRLPSRRGP